MYVYLLSISLIMKITIIGSGNVARSLGWGWLRSGHEVAFGVRNPDSPKALTAKEKCPDAKFRTVSESVKDADVVVFATPPDIYPAALEGIAFKPGAVLIDATNSVRTKPTGFPTVYHALRSHYPNLPVVKCFNSTGAENLANPSYEVAMPEPCRISLDMFMCSNHEEGKKICTELVMDLGFENCYHFGGDNQVELLEQLAFSWINLAIMQGLGRNIAFKVIRSNGRM